MLALVGSVLSVQGNAGEDNAELGGYCPVAYIKKEQAIKGSAEFASTYQGKTYYLVNQGAKDLFDKNPEKFLPEYDGYCAYGMTFGKKFPVDPTVFTVVDGKLYLNKNASVGETFNKDPKGYIKTADAKWAAMQ